MWQRPFFDGLYSAGSGKSPVSWMSLKSRVAAGGEERGGTEVGKRGKVGARGLVIWGKEFGFYSRYVAVNSFCLLACRKPFKVQVFSRTSDVPEQHTGQGGHLSRSVLSPVSLTCLSGPCPNLIFHKIFPVFPVRITPPPVCFFLFIALLPFCLVLILGVGLLWWRESRGMLGPYVTPSFFCIHALHLCFLCGRCPVTIYQVEITRVRISG